MIRTLELELNGTLTKFPLDCYRNTNELDFRIERIERADDAYTVECSICGQRCDPLEG